MAHKSKKKHVKHQHDHESADSPRPHPPGTKTASAALGSVATHKARLTTKAKTAAKTMMDARSATKRGKADGDAKRESRTPRTKRGGLRSMAKAAGKKAKAAGKKLAAKPKSMLARAKARVRSLLGRDAAARE